MSLLLDALKKSEAQRRRKTSPTIDLTRTPSSGNPRRPGSRWLALLLAVVVLAAAAPWLWAPVSDWIEKRQGGAGRDETGALVEATNARSGAADSETASGEDVQTEGPIERAAPAPVAGASSPRRVAATEPKPAAISESPGGQTPAASGDDSEKSPGDGDGRSVDVPPRAENVDAADNAATEPRAASDLEPSVQELERVAQDRGQQAQASEPSTPPADTSRQVNARSDNFIRPWELPQAQRAEFPDLRLTVHFYAARAADRFVLIDGERYREGQRVGPGTTLVEIRQRGAVVEFGSYRVLIE